MTCRQLVWTWWSCRAEVVDGVVVVTCGSDTRLSSLNSSHKLPEKMKKYQVYFGKHC